MNKPEKKVILITGASSGIGEARPVQMPFSFDSQHTQTSAAAVFTAESGRPWSKVASLPPCSAAMASK
jgi:hypothetical protein